MSALRARIENAAERLGLLWPLATFNSSNPLAGFEDLPFDEAVQEAGRLLGGRGYPRAEDFRQAWQSGEISNAVIEAKLEAAGVSETPDATLDALQDAETNADPDAPDAPAAALNRALCKWLGAFLDQGQSAWPMPNREWGFYAAWRALAPHDGVPGVSRSTDLPATWPDALKKVLEGIPESEWEDIFIHHLTELPGWASFIRRREQEGGEAWQEAYPITLGDLLGVRLTLASTMGVAIRTGDVPEPTVPLADDGTPLPLLWLGAWETTYRDRLLDAIDDPTARSAATNGATLMSAGFDSRPEAQLVFCIDVRSEVLRRHIETSGAYQTFGYAGFFGVPVLLDRYDNDPPVKACPPIVSPRHRINEEARPDCAAEADRFDGWQRLREAGSALYRTLKNDVAAAFGFVEGSGSAFGVALAARTLAPATVERFVDRLTQRVPDAVEISQPAVDRDAAKEPPSDEAAEADEAGDTPVSNRTPSGLSEDAKVVYAEAAFQLMGWPDTFAPIVVFTGHGSQTPNNPYKSSLDCGACAGNPGGPNARILASICNDESVRDRLRERGIDIPDDTVFVAGEHNTTTDAVRIYAGAETRGRTVDPEALDRLRRDLHTARAGTANERTEDMNVLQSRSPLEETTRRAADWAETRPEWGLARNAAFIVGPRSLTRGLDLDGRCFLHSYDWTQDDGGTGLETILTGPLVVGEWISMQYYFSTVDNAAYGSGSKITHNVVGKLGIVQGNGGDLMTGLPLQSLQTDDDHAYHRPLRLLSLVHAPVDRVETILQRQSSLRELFDHEWISLTVLDPDANRFLHYQPGGEWTEHDPVTATPETTSSD